MNNYIHKILSELVKILSFNELRVLDRKIHLAMPRFSNGFYQEHWHYFYWENQIDFWHMVPNPIRPSREDILIYKDLISEYVKRNGPVRKILLLGSTPELRDLLSELPEASVYLADFSFRMPIGMLKFTAKADPLKEIWIKANWLELPFPENFFDIILGDLILQQFPPEIEPIFLEKMRFFLKEAGFFIGRFHFLDEKMRQEDISDVIKRTLAAKMSDEEKFILLKLRILWLFADPKKRKLNREQSAMEFKKFVEIHKIGNPVVEKALGATLADKDSDRNWSPPTESDLKEILQKSFTITDSKIASDYEDAIYYPIFNLSPKI